MQKRVKIIVIGGVAAGPKTAAKIMRLNPDANITILEKGTYLSYAGCGLPYYVSGVVAEQKELMATPAGAVRDSAFFQKVKNIRVLTNTEATEIDTNSKQVKAVNRVTNEEMTVEYDKLVIATGANPVRPPLPGIDLANVHVLHKIEDAEDLKTLTGGTSGRPVVIVGGGLIGVETAEALVASGCKVTMVEMMPQILAFLDWELAKLVEQHMKSKGVNVLTGVKVTAIAGNGRVEAVETDMGRLPAELVLLAIGVRPNVGLAKKAGVALGTTGAIKVDPHMQTNLTDVFAVGDCVESVDLVSGQPCYVPLGSTANKQGRVAAINICGGNEKFPGVVGSVVCKAFDYCVGKTGLSEGAARKQGYEVVTALAPAPDIAHYMPSAKLLMMKMVADAKTRRLLGLQVAGPGEGAKRIDVAAMALTAGMTVDQLAHVDLCYAPPYAPAMDNIITAANIARNKLDGYMRGLSPVEVRKRLDAGEDLVLLDVRSPQEFQQVRIPGSINIPLGALRTRLGELDKGKHIVAFCKISLRGYEGALILKAAGYENVSVLDGGVAMWPFEKQT